VSEFEITKDEILAQIRAGAEEKHSGNQGRIHRLRLEGRDLVVKAPPGDNAVMQMLGRFMLRREYAIYRQLQGVDGIPDCLALVGDSFLVLEYVESSTFREAVIDDRPRFFAEFRAIIDAIHDRGVAHGDLTRKENILVTREQRPILVDFGVSTIWKAGLHPLNHAWHRFLSQHDLNAWVKHKNGGRVDRLSEADAEVYRPLALDRWARKIKAAWRSLRGKPLKRRA
jgi:serine/threonine protein kinase